MSRGPAARGARGEPCGFAGCRTWRSGVADLSMVLRGSAPARHSGPVAAGPGAPERRSLPWCPDPRAFSQGRPAARYRGDAATSLCPCPGSRQHHRRSRDRGPTVGEVPPALTAGGAPRFRPCRVGGPVLLRGLSRRPRSPDHVRTRLPCPRRDPRTPPPAARRRARVTPPPSTPGRITTPRPEGGTWCSTRVKRRRSAPAASASSRDHAPDAGPPPAPDSSRRPTTG